MLMRLAKNERSTLSECGSLEMRFHQIMVYDKPPEKVFQGANARSGRVWWVKEIYNVHVEATQNNSGDCMHFQSPGWLLGQFRWSCLPNGNYLQECVHVHVNISVSHHNLKSTAWNKRMWECYWFADSNSRLTNQKHWCWKAHVNFFLSWAKQQIKPTN